ncbi:hypothetical protein AB7783_19600 [Tardiphaga sp. 172_B4_N1_3]|uniref:hypothetical protein n=1 Tax=Tardiphaga sp. 172_B4_N1_3 TaxID=3240787 RepID=UPI003F8934C6
MTITPQTKKAAAESRLNDFRDRALPLLRMSIGVGAAVTMIRDDEFAPINLRAQTTKNAASRRKRRFFLI